MKKMIPFALIAIMIFSVITCFAELPDDGPTLEEVEAAFEAADDSEVSGSTFDHPMWWDREIESWVEWEPLLPDSDENDTSVITATVRSIAPSDDGIYLFDYTPDYNIGYYSEAHDAYWHLIDIEMDADIECIASAVMAVIGECDGAEGIVMQYDYEKDSEWIYGGRVTVGACEECLFELKEPFAFRFTFFAPAGDDWFYTFGAEDIYAWQR